MAANAYATPTPGPLGNKPFGADFDAGVTTRPLTLVTEDGATTYTIFVGTGADLYMKAGVPANAGDGTIIGTQS